jgi:putative transcriptional regulator
VNVRRETIVFLEKNRYNPSQKLAHDIASVFDVKIEEIFLFD